MTKIRLPPVRRFLSFEEIPETMNSIPHVPGSSASSAEKAGLESHETGATNFPSRIVAFRDESVVRASSRLKKAFEVARIAHTQDFGSSQSMAEKSDRAELLVYDNLGIGLLRVDDPEKLDYLRIRLRNSPDYRILRPDSSAHWADSKARPDDGNAEEPAKRPPKTGRRGSQDTQHLRTAQASSRGFEDNRRQSWAIQACGITSRWTGQGAKIAILDTGIDLAHPDWRNRPFRQRSFIDDTPQDFHGHGTQCAGLAAGLPVDSEVPRYAAAPGADLFVAKVLEKDGCGKDSVILAGIDWAMGQGCQILSLSVGVQSNVPDPDPVYELVGRRCLKSGVLFVAAAGNDSQRPNLVRPVSRPANCPSIFAVGAVDRHLRLAPFTNGSTPFGRGQIDAVAPGVDVFTTCPGPSPYGRFSGTSMATPLCAGVAALLIQDDPECLGYKLWQKLATVARRLPLSSTDVGLGLISLLQYRK